MPEWTGTFAGAGLYGDIPEDLYHRDIVPEGSLSVSGAKKLLPPSCPAIYDYDRAHPKRASRSMELGTVVHGMILGTGQEVAVVDAADYRTKAAKEARDAALAAGMVPMLPHEHAQAEEIVAAVRQHETAAALLEDSDPEVSMFWQDEEFGIWLRGRMDAMTYHGLGGPAIVDLKTAADASPERFAKSVADFGYYMQDPWYRQGLAACLGCEWQDIDFIFIVVPTTPPYLPMTYRIADADVERGGERNRMAREIYRDCTASGAWPSWSDEIEDLALPGYARQRIDKHTNEWLGISYDF